MYGKTSASAIVGVEGTEVTVESDYSDGLPQFNIVGCLENEVRESRERVKAALKNSQILIPPGRLTVNLSPADLRKQGNSYDLAIAVSVMIAVGVVPQQFADDLMFVGELSLEGTLRSVNGTVSYAILAHDLHKKGLIVPRQNAREGAIIDGIDVYGFDTLREVMDFLLDNSTKQPVSHELDEETDEKKKNQPDYSEVFGQNSVKRAAEVAAAGMHAFLMVGPAGCGKTLIARRIPTILPPLTPEEQLETSRIHSVAGILNREEGLVKMRPFRSPHHTISGAALVGGGTIPKPGEMSLAHNGVLFLDELPEHSARTLDMMRTGLEDKKITISRSQGSYTFPSRVMLVCAMNPCKCGKYPGPDCTCSQADVKRYLSRISKPLLDRIDIEVEVQPVMIDDLHSAKPGESSGDIRKRVIAAWEIQKERYKDLNIVFNSELEGGQIRKYCPLGKEERDLLKEVFSKMKLSARAHDRILKVSRTIADLEGTENINTDHLAEAVSYRGLDRKFWS